MSNRPSRFEIQLASNLTIAALVFVGFATSSIASAAESKGSPAQPSLIFGDRPLFPHWIRALAGSIDVEIADLDLGGDQFRSIRLPLRMDGQTITVTGATAAFANGSLTLDLSQDQKQTSVAVSGRNIAAGGVAALAGAAVSAPIDFDVNVVGVGWSPRELAATADGTVTVDVRSGMIAYVKLQRAGQDLFSLMIAGLNPFRKRETPTELICAKAHLDIVDGVVNAERLFGMQTGVIDIACGGTLNFRSERVSLACRPKQGAGLQSERSSLLEALKISGSFVQPELDVDKVGILRQGASLGAGITRLGLPILPGARRRSAGGRPCEIVLP